MSRKCKDIFGDKTLNKITSTGTRGKVVNKKDKEGYSLICDPTYCCTTKTTKASLEYRDPSKSGGGVTR